MWTTEVPVESWPVFLNDLKAVDSTLVDWILNASVYDQTPVLSCPSLVPNVPDAVEQPVIANPATSSSDVAGSVVARG